MLEQRRRLEPTSRDDRAALSDDGGGYLKAGVVAAIVLIGGVGGWAASASLAGAVLAQGTVVVDSNVRKVQHPAGGIVGQLRVRDGDMVDAGDVVVRLDETITRANLGVITKQLDEIAVRRTRLKAEREGAASVEVPPALHAR